MIRLTVPSIEEDDLRAVREVLASSFLVQGPRVAAFEDTVAHAVDATYAVAVSSGTAALQLALLALDTRPGDIVVVTAYSWIATGNVITLCGAVPAFVDIHPRTFNLEPSCLERTLEALMEDPDRAGRVRAVLPVHTFGQMADMPAILELAGRFGLPVIEDAACALGASLNGRQAGTWSALGCFSFHPRKAITTGEGGMIVTSERRLADRLRALRNHGRSVGPDPDFVFPGFNYRITEFQAALGHTQMKKLDRVMAARRRAAAHYDGLLEGTPVRPPFVAPGSRSVYQSYVTTLPAAAAQHRQKLIERMKERGIETAIGTLHMPMTGHFRKQLGCRRGDFPVTDVVFEQSLTLPLYESISRSDQETVVRNLLETIADLEGTRVCH